MADLISRQAAIDALHMHLMYRMGTDSNKKRLDDWINNLPSAQPEIVRCKDCKWGREVCGNIECFVDSNIPPEYHGYEWFCPNGER